MPAVVPHSNLDQSSQPAAIEQIALNMVQSEEVSFTEADGAGTYTAEFPLPKNTTLLNILVTNREPWAADTAVMSIGDETDPIAFAASLDLKVDSGGVTASVGEPQFWAEEKTIIGVIVTTGDAGSSGLTRMRIVYAVTPEDYREWSVKT